MFVKMHAVAIAVLTAASLFRLVRVGLCEIDVAGFLHCFAKTSDRPYVLRIERPIRSFSFGVWVADFVSRRRFD